MIKIFVNNRSTQITCLKNTKLTVEIGDNISIRQFLLDKGINKEQISYIMPIVNGELKNLNYILTNNDNLMLISPIAGG